MKLTNGVRVRDAMAQLSTIFPVMAIFGTVVDMFKVGPFRYIIFTITAPVEWLVVNRKVFGLSLTHVPPSTPLEVTLTSSPARPGCFIEAAGSLDSILTYKRTILDSHNNTMSHLEEILSKLDDADREAVNSRLSLITGKLESAESEIANFKTEVRRPF